MQVSDFHTGIARSGLAGLTALRGEACCRNITVNDAAARSVGQMERYYNSSRYFDGLAMAIGHLAEIESCDAIIPVFLDLACRMTAAEAASFLTCSNQRLAFCHVNDQRLSADALQRIKSQGSFKADQGIAGLVARRREAVVVGNAQQDIRFFNKIDRLTGKVTRNLLAVPVLYAGRLLGVMEVINKKAGRGFSGLDRKAMQNLADLFAVGIARAELLEEQRVWHRLAARMKMAAKIQSHFLPEYTMVKRDTHIRGFSMPAEYLGGDLYDWMPMPDGSWTVYIADVSDKGPPAALYMAALWSRMRIEVYLHRQISDILRGLNTAMYSLMAQEGFFATILICNFHPETGRLLMASGGHLPALKVSNDEVEEIPRSRGVALGLQRNPYFREEKFQLSRGQSVLLFSDGVTEARNRTDAFFGFHGIKQYVRAKDGPPWGDGLARAVEKWCSPSKPADDLTIVEMWRNPVPCRA